MMDVDYKEEAAWEVDLDPDAEPSLVIDTGEPSGLTCGFCERVLLNEEELLAHASTEHDISPDAFAGVALGDAGAVREAFFRAANMRREFVSLGEVERCPKCSLLFASSVLLASHNCSAGSEPAPDPLGLGPRDPLLVAKVDVDEAKARWLKERNSKISKVLNSIASTVLVNRIVKPLAKPQIRLTVGNIIEMSLVETISIAGLKVGRPDEFNEESALETVYQLCLFSQKELASQLRELAPHVCLQLLHLLRSRRIRVPASEPSLPNYNSSIIFVEGNKVPIPAMKPFTSRLRTILPAPAADGSHITLMESLLKEVSSKPPRKTRSTTSPIMYKTIQHQHAPIIHPIAILNPHTIQFKEPPKPPTPQKSSREANYKCDACCRAFEGEYQFIKHLLWQSFDQRTPIPLFCRFCPEGNRFFAFCEKGFKAHVFTTHKLPDDYVGSISLNGHILSNYSCGHCQKRKPKHFSCQAMFRRHLSTCCRRETCKTCPAYFKSTPENPKQHKKIIEKLSKPLKRKHGVKKTSTAKQRKIIPLAPVECILVKQEAYFDSESSLEQGQSFEADELAQESNEETAVTNFEEVTIKEERVEFEAGGPYKCVACERETATARLLRDHFTSQHASLVDEFQVSVSRCGSVSVRWACPLCGRIFCQEEAFLGHMDQHGLTSEAVLAHAIDLRHLPSLRAVLLDLKSKVQ